jgi:hypothetical protein
MINVPENQFSIEGRVMSPFVERQSRHGRGYVRLTVPVIVSKGAVVSKCFRHELGVTSPCCFNLRRDLSLDLLLQQK